MFFRPASAGAAALALVSCQNRPDEAIIEVVDGLRDRRNAAFFKAKDIDENTDIPCRIATASR